MKSRVYRSLIVMLVWFCFVGHAAGEVIYSNFGPEQGFDASQGWTVNGYQGPEIGQQAIAHQFTPEATAIFAGADIALRFWSGPLKLAVFLQTDSDGLPGQVIERIDLTGLDYQEPTIYTASSVLRPKLRSGIPYWLTVVAGDSVVVAGWCWNSVGDNSTEINFASTQGGSPEGPWSFAFVGTTRGAFQINSSPPTAQEAVDFLMDDVEVLLQEGTLTQDQADGLLDKLGAAFASLNRGNTGAACNQLDAFINQASAFSRVGIVPQDQGQELISAAEAIQDQVCF